MRCSSISRCPRRQSCCARCCNTGTRAAVQDVGLFLDSGGAADSYVWPDDTRTPADDSSFGFATNGLPAEHGAAIDGDGETAVHAVP